MKRLPIFMATIASLVTAMTVTATKAARDPGQGSQRMSLGTKDVSPVGGLVGGLASRANTQFICELSAFFSTDPEIRTLASVHLNQKSGRDSKRSNNAVRMQLDGRGLAHCQSRSGFTTEFPVHATVFAESTDEIRKAVGEITLSLNSLPFVVDTELHEIEDRYVIRKLSSFSETSTILASGNRNGVVMNLQLGSNGSSTPTLRIQELRLEFDASAPDFEQ